MNLNELRNVQLVLTDTLREVVTICNEYNIKYYLMYGSLLGAVRHSGTIPWDMDVDIAMSREDFNLFTKVAPQQLDERFFFQNSSSDPKCNITSARVQVVGTRLFFINEKDSVGNNSRLHIDVYPLDYVKEYNTINAKIINSIVLFLLRLKSFKMGNRSVNNDKKLSKKIILHTSNVLTFWMKGHYFDNLVEKLLVDKTGKSNHVSVIHTIYGYLHDLYSPEWFEKSIECKYESLIVTIPAGYDKILSKTYGDYMTPPPENKRYNPLLKQLQVDFGEYYSEFLVKDKVEIND